MPLNDLLILWLFRLLRCCHEDVTITPGFNVQNHMPSYLCHAVTFVIGLLHVLCFIKS